MHSDQPVNSHRTAGRINAYEIQCQGGTSDRIFPKGIDPALYEYILSYV